VFTVDSKCDLGRSGIYQIRNKVNGKVYIGSAKTFSKRLKEHRYELRKGTHHSKHLQMAVEKYGADSFIFEVLEYVDDEHLLLEREKYWLDTVKPYEHDKGYNIQKEPGGSNLGRRFGKEFRELQSKLKTGQNHPNWGKHLSEETKRKISEAQSGEKGYWYGKRFSEEHRRKIGLKSRGRRHTEESKAKIAEGRLGSDNPYAKLTEDSVREIKKLLGEGYSLSKLSKMYGVSTSALSKIKRGKTWSHIT